MTSNTSDYKTSVLRDIHNTTYPMEKTRDFLGIILVCLSMDIFIEVFDCAVLCCAARVENNLVPNLVANS